MDTPPAERRERLQSSVHQLVGQILGIPQAEVDLDRPITAMGLDSLMAIDLKNIVENEAGIVVPTVQILEGPSVRELTSLMETLLWAGADSQRGAPARAGEREIVDI